jgi:predicted nucleic acid-binding protein
MFAAFATHQRFGISYWDAAIIEAARSLGCSELLTEDLQDEQDFGGIYAVNPFRDGAKERRTG